MNMKRRWISAIAAAAVAAPIIPALPILSAIPAKAAEVVYREDFEAEGLRDIIQSMGDGWSYDGDRLTEQISIDVNDEQNTSNALRFANGDAWFNSIWIDLDLKENGIIKRTAAGESRETAANEVTKYLSEDMTLSFRAKLDVDGLSEKGTELHESFIKVKNAETAGITEIGTKGDMLYVRGEGQDEYYYIKEIDRSKENTDWHTFSIAYNMRGNTYRLTVDGEETEVNGVKDIPVGAGDGGAEIGMIQTLEIGHYYSGWWQRWLLDDVTIESGSSNPDVTPSVNPDGTPAPTGTPRPTATPKPTAEPGVYFYEPFEDNGLEQEMEFKENGWGWGEADNSVGSAHISVDNYGSGSGKSLRFSSQNYFKNVWMTLDLTESGVARRVAAGENEAAARAAVTEYLSGNLKISFRAKFGQDGRDESNVHEQYIRIKGEDNHVITDIHLYNDELSLVALNEEQTANESYNIKTVDWASGANEWHDFAIYFDKERNAYMVEVDGELLSSTPHGRWIPAGSGTGLDASAPADMGKISSIELGHYWSGWWSTLHIDDLKISEYAPETEKFEIVNVNIVNQHGSTSISHGNRYDAQVYVTGGTADRLDMVWSKSCDNGATWESMTEKTIPANVNRIRVEVTAVSAEGETAAFTKEAAINPSGSVDYENIIYENFESGSKENEIRSQTNGWLITGTSFQVDVGTGFGGTANSMRFASTNSNQNSNLSLNLIKRGARYDAGDRIRVKFAFAFGLGSDDDSLTSNSSSYVRVKDVSGTAFAAIELHGETMSVVYYDESEGKNKSIVIASGKSQVIDRWRNVEIYIDTEINKYCVIIDGTAVTNGDTGWFTPSNSIIEGIGEPIKVTGIGMIDIGQENSLWWANTMLDELSVDKYYLPSENQFSIRDITLTNAFSPRLAIVQGARINAAPEPDIEADISENVAVTESVYEWSGIDESGAELKTDGAVVPYNAVSIRVRGAFKNKVGMTAEYEKEISVGKNSAPSVNNLTVNGDFKAGVTLTAQYSFSDAEAPDKDNTEISWYRSDSRDGDYALIATGSEYVLKSADTTRYIKIRAVPKDSYGAEGEAAELILSAKDISDFDRAWSRLSIVTNIPANAGAITLPSYDEETGIRFSWSSGSPTVITDDGMVYHGRTAQTVTLTATAVNPAGETRTRRFTVTVSAAYQSGSVGGGSGGAGGGGRGNGAVVGNGFIPVPTQNPVDYIPQNLTDENSSGGFPDVSKEAWYYEYVDRLLTLGIVSGDENGNFRPDGMITRAEFLKMIVGIFNILDEDARCEFSDVPEGSWYYGFVASAVKFDIAEGVGGEMFNPSANISRQDMAVMAARAARLSGILPDKGGLDFADNADISDYAVESVSQMAATGILSGDNGYFNPRDNATRAQAAKVISMLKDALN